MIEYTLDKENSILLVQPKTSLQKDDFEQLAQAVDPFIEENGSLAGLIIESPGFPGWENLGAMVQHFHFVQDHHRKVGKVAVVTDSTLGDVAEHLASHFVSAEIRHFPAKELETAKAWITNTPAE